MQDDFVPPDLAALTRELDDYEKRITIAELAHHFLAAAHLASDASTLAAKYDLFERAATFDERALREFETIPQPVAPAHRALLVKYLTKSSMNHLLVRDPDTAVARMQEALRLADESIPARLRANVHWNAAVLSQWRGEPLDGLSHALSAWEYYHKRGPASERLRLRAQIAVLAIKLAESARSQPMRGPFGEYVRLAEHHLHKAYLRYHTWFPPDADAVLPLAWVRLSRLTRPNEDRLPIIHETLNGTIETNDAIGHGQALVALADELLWQGKTEAAREAYIRAYYFQLQTQAPGMAIGPMGLLLRGGEEGWW